MNEAESSPPSEQDREAPKQVDIVGASDIALTGLFILALFYTLYFTAALLLPIVMALLGAILFAPAVRALAKWRIPAPLSALAIVAGLLGIVGGTIYFLADPATA